jgi:uncharacterized membrane protein
VVVVAFLAAAVEMVEALTLVLAAGISRGWRSALLGAGAALALLLLVVAVFGLEVLRLIPIDDLRIVLGAFLLLFGMKWLKKAVLRASGRKSLHAEDAIYAHQVAALGGDPPVAAGIDGEGFATAFNGTLLEGLEVALIIVAVGSSTGQLGSASLGAVAAAVLVGAAGVVFRAPLARVPENFIKFVVGLMLTTFGTFWAGEGLGVAWPGHDLSVLGLLALYVLFSLAAVRWQRPAASAGSRLQHGEAS